MMREQQLQVDRQWCPGAIIYYIYIIAPGGAHVQVAMLSTSEMSAPWSELIAAAPALTRSHISINVSHYSDS
jgi:hypothetical protein